MRWRGIGVSIVLGLTLAACSKNLSKEKAREVIQKNHYDKDDNMYCSWREVVQREGASDKEAVFWPILPDGKKQCLSALATAQVVKDLGCRDKRCEEHRYALGSKGDSFTKGGFPQFACGKKKLGDVLSVTTEARKATVKYRRTFIRDEALTKALAGCDIDGEKSGDEEQTMKMKQDDDGNWSPDY